MNGFSILLTILLLAGADLLAAQMRRAHALPAREQPALAPAVPGPSLRAAHGLMPPNKVLAL